MKIAVAGKGGVGKSTIAGILARQFAASGRRVIAVDVDPDANLARCIGLSEEQISSIVPLSEMRNLVRERTVRNYGLLGSILKRNPKVDDIPEKFSILHEGVRFLQFGSTKKGGSGCYCPENSLLRELMKHLLVESEDVIILDMEAGIEHLSRGTAASVDSLIVVVAPGRLSIETATRIRSLAKDVGIPSLAVVGNKVRTDRDREAIQTGLPDFTILGFLPYDESILEADLNGISPFDIDSQFKEVLEKIRQRMLEI